MRIVPSAIAVAVLFLLLPAVAAGGALAAPVLLGLAGALAFRPSLLVQFIGNRDLFAILLLAFTAWAMASSLWSGYADHSQAAKLGAVVALGLMFAASATASPRLTRAAGVAAFIVLAVLLAIEALWDLPIHRSAQPDAPIGNLESHVNRGTTVLLAMTWAVGSALLVADRGGLARAALLLSVLLMLPYGQLASVAGFFAGLLVYAIAFKAPRFALLSVTGGLALWMLAAPFATPLLLADPRLVRALPESWSIRAGIWDYICGRILEAPVLGHGLDASRTVTDRIIVNGVDMPGVQLHPHSGSLQIWFETGGIGAALAALALLCGGWSLSRAFARNRPAAAAAAATIASLGVIANVSYGVWQEWWNAAMFIAAAMVGALSLQRA